MLIIWKRTKKLIKLTTEFSSMWQYFRLFSFYRCVPASVIVFCSIHHTIFISRETKIEILAFLEVFQPWMGFCAIRIIELHTYLFIIPPISKLISQLKTDYMFLLWILRIREILSLIHSRQIAVCHLIETALHTHTSTSEQAQQNWEKNSSIYGQKMCVTIFFFQKT